MQGKLLGIINVDFDATGQLMIIYSAFVKYATKKKREYNKACKKTDDSVRREVLYSTLTELCILTKLARLIKIYPTEAYSRVRVGKNLSDKCLLVKV